MSLLRSRFLFLRALTLPLAVAHPKTRHTGHLKKRKTGVYANGFGEGSTPPPGPQACMRVGDLLVSVDGKDVQGASLAVALSAIEAARRRVSRVESSGFSSEAGACTWL